MEQQLINVLIALLNKTGAGCLIKDLIKEVDDDGNSKRWNPSEIEKAIQYVKWQTENFGTAEASAIIDILLKKYNLRPQNFSTGEEAPLPEPISVKGLK